jgi:4-amino-4-deoxy-L-arabinose transferase-like glycosyltransferase
MKPSLAFVLAALVVVQAGLFIGNASATVDEPGYLRMAAAALTAGDTREFALRGVAPLPVLLYYALPVRAHVDDLPQAILLARMGAVAFVAVPLVLVVYLWTAAEFGTWIGAAAAALLALSPTAIAHGSLATTDACFVLFALLTLWALVRYIERPAWTRGALLVCAGAAAIAAKYSGIMLFAVTGIALLWMDRPERRVAARIATAAIVIGATGGLGLALTWNYHPIDGLTSQINHQRLGHEAYLLGRRGTTGWWYYQPFALAVKSTYLELVALTVALLSVLTLRRAQSVSLRVAVIGFVVMLVLGMTSRVAIGVRYLLLVVPLALVIGAAWLARLSVRRPVSAAAIAIVALALQGAAAFDASPRPLSYFNGLAGGPMNGYRLLADSNLDWGQDLPAMRRALARVGARDPLVAYFGSAPTAAYGLQVREWNLTPPQVKARCDWIVISATSLVGLYTGNDDFAAFRAIEPTVRPTATLFVYDAARPEVQAALADAIARSPS